jgi:hypothetical protein
MRGTGDWVTNQRPENWRQQILYLYPNGMMPLTAILSMMPSERVDDPHYHWWTENIADIIGDVANVYTDAACTTAYVSGGVAGDVVYIRIDDSVANYIRVGHQILLRDASHYDVDVVGEVVFVDVVSGTNLSTLGVKLLEADDNGATTDLSDCDSFKIIGNINSEGAEMPDAIQRDPTEWYNYTQIFRTPLSITRTARLTKLRTENDYQKMKREALETHGIEMENAFWWGIRTLGTGDNGKPKRTTLGLINWIRANIAANCDDYSLNTDYATDAWTTSGEIWFDIMLEQMFRYGSSEKLAVCGSGALLGINRLAKAGGQVNLVPGAAEYGIKVIQWITPFGVLNLKTHPLFSYDATTRNMMVIFEPKDLIYKYITDTTFYLDKEKDSRNGKRLDATIEEYLTECGLEFHHPEKCGILNGVGVDSTFATTVP